MTPTTSTRIVTLVKLAEAARALLDDVVDHKPVKAAAIQANLPVYERAADLIDLLAEYDRQRTAVSA